MEETKALNNKRLSPSEALGFMQNHTSLVVLIIMIIIGAVTSDNFFSIQNISNLLRRISVNGIMTIGFTLTFIVGGFDLSIGATLSLSAILFVGVQTATGSYFLGFLAAMVAGFGMGLLNGLLMKITKGGAGEAFLITLGTQMVATSLATTYCNGYDLYGDGNGLYYVLGKGTFLGIPVCACLWLLILIFFQILIKKRKMGRCMLYTGINKKAAYISGINVNRLKVIAFVFAGVLAAVSGVVMASITSAASPRSGNGADFDACVACMVGGNSTITEKNGMIQSLIGVLIFGLITNILNLWGISSVVQYIVKGAVLLVVICLDKLKRR